MGAPAGMDVSVNAGHATPDPLITDIGALAQGVKPAFLGEIVLIRSLPPGATRVRALSQTRPRRIPR
jgi:hypothetical protein